MGTGILGMSCIELVGFGHVLVGCLGEDRSHDMRPGEEGVLRLIAERTDSEP